MSKVKVLVADDEKSIADVFVMKVQAEGYEAMVAYDGAEAWQIIQDESPDIIILDINMPHKDGFTILKDLRANPTSDQWQPVIIVSSRSELNDLREGMDLEADHYLTKPCSARDVLQAVKLMENLRHHHKTGEDAD